MANIDSVKLPNGNEYNLQDVVTPRTAASQPNLLMNPWFTVNQRGETSGTVPANVFKVDRWKMDHGSGGAGTWSLSSGVFTLTPASTSWNMIAQDTEIGSSLDGETLTMSLKLSDNSIVSHTFTRTSSAMEQYAFTGGELRLTAAGVLQVLAFNGIALAFKAVKVEIGSESTLHLDTAPDYSTELLKCQRYFVRWKANQYGRFCIGIMETATTTRIIRFLPVPMRIVPAITSSGSFTVYQPGSSSSVVSSMQIITSSTPQDVSIEVTTSSSLTQGATVTVAATSSGGSYFDFNAEL